MRKFIIQLVQLQQTYAYVFYVHSKSFFVLFWLCYFFSNLKVQTEKRVQRIDLSRDYREGLLNQLTTTSIWKVNRKEESMMTDSSAESAQTQGSRSTIVESPWDSK